MLSICIPAFNSENKISRLVNCIIEQDNEFLDKIIIVNDGSTDNTLIICNRLKSKCQKIHIIDQKNKGAGGARNSAFSYVTSEYFSFIDCDDIIPEYYIATVSREIKKKKSDIYIFDYIKEQINGDKNLIKGSIKGTALPCCIFSTKYWRDKNFKFLERSIYEDNAIRYYIFNLTDSKIKIDKAIYYYIQNKNSISVKKTVNMILGRISSAREFICNAERYNISIPDEIYLSHVVKWYEIAISACFYRVGSYKLIKNVIDEFDQLDHKIAKMANRKTILIRFLINSMGRAGYQLISLTKLSKKFK